MATDVEESDTDDHERPGPAKRQRTKNFNSNENSETGNQLIPSQQIENADFEDPDEVERLSREKLKRWQACQVAKGFVDNTINKVLENYIMTPPSYSLEDASFRLFRENEMENTAVMMAIRNHGLVQSTGFIPESSRLDRNNGSSYWNRNNYSDESCSYTSNHLQVNANYSNVVPTTSSSTERFEVPYEEDKNKEVNWDEEKIDDSNQQEDFLERAVAEAIKKKGLSALSVDYG